MKQLLSIGETLVPWIMQQLFHAYCTPLTCGGMTVITVIIAAK